MIQSLLLLIALSQLVCGLANAGESAKINLDNISFISGWTKSGKVQFINANEEILGKADQLPIDTLWRWQQTLYNNDGFVKSHIPYVVHASTSSARTEYQ